MHIRSKLVGGAAVSVAALALGAAPASAAAGFDPATGTGFIGKGDVQTALGFNNAALQKAVDAKSLSFTAKQPATQSLAQDVTQSASQTGTQSATQTGTQTATQTATQAIVQTLTCTFTNGNGTKTFHRAGERDAVRTATRTASHTGTRTGSRDASREGTRAGSRSGSLTGTLGYDVDADARKANQYTGFVLKGWKGEPTFEAGTADWNAPAFGDWTFGDYAFGDFDFGPYAFGDYTFGDYAFGPLTGVVWDAWDAAPGENPDDCLRSSNADKITQLSNVITPGAITDGPVTAGAVVGGAVVPGSVTDGPVTEGAIAYGDTVTGAKTPTGPVKLFVNGKAL
ncbi:hypothetical protein [Streptomyces sp. NRRL B-24484]|uniref:hypothetical protein n=1 Tax=Streptomyces sp. NRRL B-24484 TaxID=1463833 RepID=UPI0004BE6E04|nr:hypothetical protein [Streptomyces sp. NRRL B-24484]